MTQVDCHTIHQSISSISCVHYISIHSRDILSIHHFAPGSPIIQIFNYICTDDWVRTNDLQDMNLSLSTNWATSVCYEWMDFIPSFLGIPSVLNLEYYTTPTVWSGVRESNPHIQLGRLTFYCWTNSAFVWVGRDSNPLTARPIRQFVFRLDLQSSAVTYPICYGKRIRTSVAALNGRHTNLYMIP